MAASQTCTSAAPQLHAACMPRGGRNEGDVDRAAGRGRARGWAVSATAAAAAIRRGRAGSSSRFIKTTCAACRQRGEAQGESRLTTEDRRRAREGLRFDSRALRTLSSSKWMKSEAPTSLETDLDVKSDLVAVPRAPSALRRCARYTILLWPPQTTGRLVMAARRGSSLP